MIRKMKLARIGLGSAVKIGFFLSAAAGLLLGLFFGVLLALFSSLAAMAVHARQPGMGPGALIVLPVISALFCGFFGAMISFLGALVYNLAAGTSGGLDIEAELRDEPAPAAELVPLRTVSQDSSAGITASERPKALRRFPFRAPSERPREIGLRRARRKAW